MHDFDCQCSTCVIRRVILPANVPMNLSPTLDLVDEV